jgi:dynein heavy chain
MPLMSDRQETRIVMDKFVKQVNISMQQAYGNITINVPDLPENASPEQLCNDKALIEELINTVEQWTSTIKETIDRENQRTKETKSAQAETEYWRQRNATFNTLYQQLNMKQVKDILDVLKINEEKADGYSLENYNNQY